MVLLVIIELSTIDSVGEPFTVSTIDQLLLIGILINKILINIQMYKTCSKALTVKGSPLNQGR